ncbi:MAG: cation-translocating P-type ATPase [Bacillota bacterium]
MEGRPIIGTTTAAAPAAATPPSTRPWHALPAEEVCRRLGTDPGRGLSSAVASARLQELGPNRLPEVPGRTVWAMFIDQIREPLVLILIAAAGISVALGEFTDAAAILAIVVLNAVLGVTQESRAEHALAALRELMHPTARVVRDGRLIEIAAAELVPGDVVLIEAGSRIPADLRLVETANLHLDESPLTGESVPVRKEAGAVFEAGTPVADRLNLAYMGTAATYGRGVGVVTGTGPATEMGRIAALLEEDGPEPTPLQRRLGELGKVLGGLALGVVVVVFAVGIARGEPLVEMFLTSVGLAVAAIPEGLPAVVTIVLALGVQRMARRQAIVRRLPAVETLGAATVIASDKTGTITQNRMEAVQAWVDGQSFEPRGDNPDGTLDWLLRGGALVNDARLERREDGKGFRSVGDPTETALLAAAARAGLWPDDLRHAYPRVGEVPFDSERKRMSTVHRNAPGSPQWPGPEELSRAPFLLFTKGSPESILGRCRAILRDGRIEPLDDRHRQAVLDANSAMARQALRVLAVAARPLSSPPEALDEATAERELVLIGLIGLIDPPRPEAAEAVRISREAGVRPIMITGDHRDTAAAIAAQVGLLRGDGQARVVTGAELEKMTDAELDALVESVDVYARVSPEHKLRIVEALKRHGHVVAVTGDGVNDAPALKRADVGAAMGITGTDAAKGAADMVLADDNFATVVAAVAEGRTIFENIKKVVHYLLSANLSEILAIFAAIVAGLGRPLTAIQILWVNLVTDGLPALALGVDPAEPGLMRRPPRKSDEGVFGGGMAWRDAYQGLLLGGLTLGVFAWMLRTGRTTIEARTAAFATLGFSQLFHSFNLRSTTQSLLRLGPLSNGWLVGAFFAGAALQLAAITWAPLARAFESAPLDGKAWAVIAAASAAPVVAVETVKAAERVVRAARSGLRRG